MFTINKVKYRIKSIAMDNYFETLCTQCIEPQLFGGSSFPKSFFGQPFINRLIDMIEKTPVIFYTLLLQHLWQSFLTSHRMVGWNYMKSTCRVVGHSLIYSHVRSHRSLIRLFRTASFARSRAPLHSFISLLTNSLRSSWERYWCLSIESVIFIKFQPIVQRSLSSIGLNGAAVTEFPSKLCS